MKVINFFGGPGCGKSSTAAHLFALMKWEEYKVEHIQEYIKSMVYEERNNIFSDQIYIFGKQQRRQHVLRKHVDWVVTDSPLLLSAVYAPVDYFPAFKQLAQQVHHSYDNINILLNRVKPYQQYGRNQDEHEAREIDERVRDVLVDNSVEFWEIDGTEHAASIILSKIGNLSGESDGRTA